MNEVIQINTSEHKPLSALDIQNQVNTIQHVMNQVMKKDVHFGVIPGTKTPSLYKPGAEKIMATFRLSADPEVTDLSDSDHIRYLVKVRLMSPSGVHVGSGIGECSSNEEKYKWRAAVCDEEFEDVAPERKREKWNKGRWDNRSRSYGAAYKIKQIRTEPADLANTILKMAKKRALIDAVLTATAASDCFTQDIEDLPEEYLDAQQEAPRQSKPEHVNQAETPINDEQFKQLEAAMKMASVDEAYVCKKAQIQNVRELTQGRFSGCMAHLKKLAEAEGDL